MTTGLVLFNLFVNAMVAFVLSLALVLLAASALRLRSSRLCALLMLLPFAKAFHELCRGIPDQAFFWAKLEGATQQLGSLNVGVGWTWPFVPVIDCDLGAHFQGRLYAQSVSDVLATYLSTKVSHRLPALLGVSLLALAVLHVCAYLWDAGSDLVRDRRMLQTARLVAVCRLGRRQVRIFVGPGVAGAPYAGGLLRPWVCIPARVYDALSTDERAAVLAHELSHLRHYDGILLNLTFALQAVFPIAPGAARLARAIRDQCELSADQAARLVVPATSVAAALLRVAELTLRDWQPNGHLSFVRRGPLLTRRVTTLLRDHTELSVSPWQARFRLGAVVLVGVVVMRATLFGNP